VVVMAAVQWLGALRELQLLHLTVVVAAVARDQPPVKLLRTPSAYRVARTLLLVGAGAVCPRPHL
jgi:hypothetical protein